MHRSLTPAFAFASAALLCAPARAQDEWFRLFFDTRGAVEDAPRPAGNLSFTNPTVEEEGRLYFYLQYGTDNQDFNGMNFRVDILGPAAFTGALIYDHDIPAAGIDRWGTIPAGSLTPQTWITGSVFKVGGANYGAKNVASLGHPHPASADSHFSLTDGSTFGTTLLGHVDVTHTGESGIAELRFYFGTSGFSGVTITPSDWVYFGFGDPALQGRKGPIDPPINELPDAYVAPEPAGLALLALAGLLWRRVRG